MALMVFTTVGPIAVAIAAALVRWGLGPRLQLRRMRRGRAARVQVRVVQPPRGGDTPWDSWRLIRVDDDAHLMGEGRHWVLPAWQLSERGVGNPVALEGDRGGSGVLIVEPRWRSVYARAVAPDGPGLPSGSWTRRWITAPRWTIGAATGMGMLSAGAAVVYANARSQDGTVVWTDGQAMACGIVFEDGGVNYEAEITCFVRPPVGDPITFHTLGWPFAGEIYDHAAAAFMFQAPLALTLLFLVRHLVGGRREQVGVKARVKEERLPEPAYSSAFWMHSYLPSVAKALRWPKVPDGAQPFRPRGPADVWPDTSHPCSFHSLQTGTGEWKMLLAGQPHERPRWLVTPASPPPRRGTAYPPRDPPSAGELLVDTAWARTDLTWLGDDKSSGWVRYDNLRDVDEYLLNSLREDLDGQLRDLEDDDAS